MGAVPCQNCGRKIKNQRVRCIYCGGYPEGYIPPECSRCARPIPPEKEVCMYCGGPPVGSEDMEVFEARHSGKRGRFRWLKRLLFLFVLLIALFIGAAIALDLPVERWIARALVQLEGAPKRKKPAKRPPKPSPKKSPPAR